MFVEIHRGNLFVDLFVHRFSLKEVNSGYKRHVSDFKEHKDPNARNFYVKPYAERRAERLAQ